MRRLVLAGSLLLLVPLSVAAAALSAGREAIPGVSGTLWVVERFDGNANTLAGSVTLAASPNAERKSESAIGVTYSWLKRTPARAKSASPGATAVTPVASRERSVTACLARIFSIMFIGRAGVVIAGGATVPA